MAPPDASPSSERGSKLNRRASWLAVALLVLAFELPPMVRNEGIAPLLFRPSADLWIILWLAWWSRSRRRAGAWKTLLIIWTTTLLVFRVDKMIFYLLMRQEPLLYDQVYMLRHAAVLVSDLWSVWMGLGILGVLVAVVALVLGTRWGVRKALAALPARPSARATRGFAAIMSGFVALGVLQHGVWGTPPPKRWQRFVHWETPLLAHNVWRSLRLYRAIGEGLRASPYRAYAEIGLDRKPDVRLYLIESYGAVMATHPMLRPWWIERMGALQTELDAAGWTSASALLRAPVSGGRSWLAEASIVTGIRVRYEAEFHQVLDQIDSAPNLVSFFDAQGYHTASLSPADRARAGVQQVNYYDYDQRITFDELDYRGKRWGWGIVPDEYSLGRADDELIAAGDEPLFLNAHLVTSHAPWLRVPGQLIGWRAWLEQSSDDVLDVDAGRDEAKAVMHSMRRFKRKDETRFMYEGEADDDKLTRFRVAINYEFDVLTGRISAIDRDAIVIIMGDHQPPLVTPETDDFSVPVHVMARDPALLRGFLDNGFVPGLVLARDAQPVAAHQGLLSIVVHAMAVCCSRADPPPVRPEGLGFDAR